MSAKIDRKTFCQLEIMFLFLNVKTVLLLLAGAGFQSVKYHDIIILRILLF